MVRRMGRARQAGGAPRAGKAGGKVLDLDRYVPALITFIGNKLSNSATVTYQKRFGVNVTQWRILSQLAIEPGSYFDGKSRPHKQPLEQAGAAQEKKPAPQL